MSGYQKMRFTMDALPNQSFVGYTNGETWNGWACPLFEKAEAERVLEACRENGYNWVYVAETDAYRVSHEDDPEGVPEQFEGFEIAMEGLSVKVYPIGAYCWIWEPAS